MPSIALCIMAVSLATALGTSQQVDAMSQEELYDIKTQENICKQEIRADNSLTFAEKLVAEKNCNAESRDIVAKMMESVPDTSTQQLIQHVRDCDTKYGEYQMLGEKLFLRLELSNLARQCTILYSLDTWNSDEPNRTMLLVEGLVSALTTELQEDREMRWQNTLSAIEKFHGPNAWVFTA